LLGLDADGHCVGVAFRLAEETLHQELAALWRREIETGAPSGHKVIRFPSLPTVTDGKGVRLYSLEEQTQ